MYPKEFLYSTVGEACEEHCIVSRNTDLTDLRLISVILGARASKSSSLMMSCFSPSAWKELPEDKMNPDRDQI